MPLSTNRKYGTLFIANRNTTKSKLVNEIKSIPYFYFFGGNLNASMRVKMAEGLSEKGVTPNNV